MMVPVVIDLSHHNPTPDWAAIKAAGVIGVIHKATEGSSYVDDTLFERARAAMDAGLKWATYHFLRPGSMSQQMAFYLNTVNPVAGERVCLDHEDEGVDLADLEEAVRILQSDPRGLQVCIYSGHVIKEQLDGNYSEVLASTSLWIAQYADEPEWPYATWPAWSLWQYTDHATVPGISAPVDGDEWNGTREALIDWFGPTGQIPIPPEPEPARPQVDVAITCPEGVELVVRVNGMPIAAMNMF